MQKAAERPVQRPLSKRPHRTLDVGQRGLARVGIDRTLARAPFLVPLDAEPEEVEALVHVGDPRLRLGEPQPHGTKYRCHLFAQGVDVGTPAGHQYHEVVRVANETVGG